ncbi:MAG: YciI family protein [Polyangiaceae bacterium]
MVMHKMTAKMEKGLDPDPEIIAGVGRLVQEGLKDQVFVSGEGLWPSSQRVRLTYANGKRTITDGPFGEAKELIGGFSLLRVRSKEEAIEWCDRFAAVIGDMDVVLGPVVEPWDLGIARKPAQPPLRFLSLYQADEGSQGDTPRDPALVAKLDALIGEMRAAGALQGTGGLEHTKHGARIRYKGGKRSVIDGPFAESKELIAGYAIIEVPPKAAAIDWALRFGDVVKVEEIDVRLMQTRLEP